MTQIIASCITVLGIAAYAFARCWEMKVAAAAVVAVTEMPMPLIVLEQSAEPLGNGEPLPLYCYGPMPSVLELALPPVMDAVGAGAPGSSEFTARV